MRGPLAPLRLALVPVFGPAMGLLVATTAFVVLARADFRDPLLNGNFEPSLRLGGVVKVRQRDARQLAADGALDRPEFRLLVRRNERERLARGLRPAGAPDRWM
jgi:hypothetical protein